MADAPTQLDLFEAGRREALVSPTRFSPAIVDTAGSDVNVVLNSSAAMAEEVAFQVQKSANALSLANARGEDLARIGYDLYQLTKFGAQNAVAVVSLTRSGTVACPIPKDSIFSTESGQTFVSKVATSFALDNQGPIEVVCTCQTTGTDGNVAAGTITVVGSSFDDPTVQCTNDETAAGGREEETDDQYRVRCRRFFTTARRGTKDAIEFGALQVAKIVQSHAEEPLDLDGLPFGRVLLSIVDVAGQANAALAGEVDVGLLEYRALGVPTIVIPGVPEYVTIRVEGLQFRAGASTTSVLDQARKAILTAVNALAPGDTLTLNVISTALGGIHLLIVPAGAITEPAGDLVPTSGTVIRTTLELVELSA